MTPAAASPTVRLADTADAGASSLRGLGRLPAAGLLGLIRIYQHTLSPLLPIVTLGRCACRFAPTCSHYAAEAIQVHGAARGVLLTLWRLVKCNPLHSGGIDPVPPRRQPRCMRTTGTAG